MTEVLVVHCVDTEGPLGGDARRLPDGSPEFYDNWDEILASLRELTGDGWRDVHADSHGRPYVFNWFVMDFTGFLTNPKCRVAEYHDTWDNIASLPVQPDGLYWHYHVPPSSGIGDQWSDTWLSSNECNVVLARRLIERGSFPAAFRAGGTIEDDAASRWLEHVIPIDFSNRVSERSVPGADLFHFNWYGAPEIWGSYHPSIDDFRRPGTMLRFVYRSIDLRSRYNTLTYEHVEAVFRDARTAERPPVLSYFSHDNRDLRPETYHVHELLARAAKATGVAWRSCTAVEAHCRHHGLQTPPVGLSLTIEEGGVTLAADSRPFQPEPFVAAELADGRFVRLYPSPLADRRWRVAFASERIRRIAAAATSFAGDVSVVRGE